MKRTTIKDRVDVLVYQAGSLRAAARKLDINHTYLWRLSKGHRTNPDDDVLAKLGLMRVTHYYLKE